MIRILISLTAISLAQPAAAQTRTYGKETSIPFASGGGIRNFE